MRELNSITAIEGYFVETKESLIFDVKGILHPRDRIIAFVRYYPSPTGARKRDGINFSKIYHLSDRLEFLRKHHPQYLFQDEYSGQLLQGVLHKDIKKIYAPLETVQNLLNKDHLNDLESDSLQLVEILKNNALDVKIGISGSIMVDLPDLHSDIDIVVYGTKNCYEVHDYLKKLMDEKKHSMRAMTLEELQKLHYFRNQHTKADFSTFIQLEKRKYISGMYNNREFFIRFVKDLTEINEKYEDYKYEKTGYAVLKGRIADDSEAIFTPSRYVLEDTKIIEGVQVKEIHEIASFRGRFCEQAKKGETVIASGKIEKVTRKDGSEWYRMVLGERREDSLLPISMTPILRTSV